MKRTRGKKNNFFVKSRIYQNLQLGAVIDCSICPELSLFPYVTICSCFISIQQEENSQRDRHKEDEHDILRRETGAMWVGID